MTRRVLPNREHGFTLIELSIALVLLALMASVLYGSLSLAGMSWDRGEAKAQQTSEMRLTEDFLRRTLTSQHPLRFQKVLEKPLYFLGTGNSLAYAAALPGRVGAGIYYFKIGLVPNGDSSRLTLSRVIPDYAATSLPDLIRMDVKAANSAAWPTLVVEPRLALQVGCLNWNPAARRCS